MTSITPNPNAGLPAPAGPAAEGARKDLAFAQRHAWMREYERAVKTQGQPEAADAPAGDPAANEGQAGAWAFGPGSAQPQGPQPPCRSTSVASATARFNPPSAVGLSSATSMRLAAVQGHPGVATLAGPAPMPGRGAAPWPSSMPESPSTDPAAPAGGQDAPHASEEAPPGTPSLTLAESEHTLSLVIRDSRLRADHADAILRRLNATGASAGRARVAVTVNGHTTEQHAPHTLKEGR